MTLTAVAASASDGKKCVLILWSVCLAHLNQFTKLYGNRILYSYSYSIRRMLSSWAKVHNSRRRKDTSGSDYAETIARHWFALTCIRIPFLPFTSSCVRPKPSMSGCLQQLFREMFSGFRSLYCMCILQYACARSLPLCLRT